MKYFRKAKKNKIENRIFNKGKPCFIIAEAGVNHNGDINLAKRLIDAAAKARVDAVKFQTFKSENLVVKHAERAAYQKKNTAKKTKQQEMLKKLELKYRDFIKLKKYSDKKKIIFLSTPHTEDAVDFLNPLVSVYKIGSGDLTNLPFLENIARKKKPIILSTGMATLNEVKEAVNIIKKSGNKKIILLHCTTSYPCRPQEVNLKAMLTLKKLFKLPVGYSDHTQGLEVCICAVAMGACIIEKHFTLDKNLPGPDHKVSLEPHELKEMVRSIRNIEKAAGDGIKIPQKSEFQIKKLVRKSIVAATDIPKGEVITPDMLTIKRPGTGIEPKFLGRILERQARKGILKDKILTWDLLI